MTKFIPQNWISDKKLTANHIQLVYNPYTFFQNLLYDEREIFIRNELHIMQDSLTKLKAIGCDYIKTIIISFFCTNDKQLENGDIITTFDLFKKYIKEQNDLCINWDKFFNCWEELHSVVYVSQDKANIMWSKICHYKKKESDEICWD